MTTEAIQRLFTATGNVWTVSQVHENQYMLHCLNSAKSSIETPVK